ncbi:MAG TPA: hypothetical protein ENF22_03975 [Chloroflexi bacterium]|nr:hypothetical protein [Chloroflexota bacterium]
MFLILVNYLIILIYMYLILEHGLRESMIRSYIIILGFVIGFTETLSLVNQITRPAILTSWSLLTFILLIILAMKLWKRKIGVFELIKIRFSEDHKPFSSLETVIMICIGLILITTFIVAFFSPPNSYDSMTYHMARVSNWIQNQNINYYPTSIPRQNYSMPMAEFEILHFQIMSQTDKFANLVQWSGFVLVILLVSKIADYLQISRRGQLLSALFAATIPMAILQSSSTQNDLITGLGCLSFGYYLLKTIREKSWKYVVYSGLSLGIALLTKGTAYIYCAAIGLVIGISGLLSITWKTRFFLIKQLASIIILALVLNSGVYYRNIDLYSNPLSTATDRVTSDKLSLQGLYTNLVRNGAVQLAIPIPEVNKYMTRLVAGHLGENNTNQDITFSNTDFVIKFNINEDESGNLLHFVLLLLGLMIYPWIKDPKRKDLSIFLISLLFSLVLFSLTLKWQPWGSRLLLPVFFLGSPLVGYVYDKIKYPRKFSIIFILSFTLYSIPYLTLNDTRPLFPLIREDSPFRTIRLRRLFSNHPFLYEQWSESITPFYEESSVLYTDRMDQYFSGYLPFRDDFFAVMDSVNELDVDVVGLELRSNSWEYPIWALANRHAGLGSPEFIHVAMDDISSTLDPFQGEWPEYVISTKGPNSFFVEELDYSYIVDTSIIDLLRR